MGKVMFLFVLAVLGITLAVGGICSAVLDDPDVDERRGGI